MTGMKLSLETARGALRLVRESDLSLQAQAFGISKEELTKVMLNRTWVAGDRGPVRRVLDNLCYGMMDMIGVARIEIAAEYVAAVIVAFVAPCNIAVACRWCEGVRSSEAVRDAAGVVQGEVSPAQLFVLCQMLYDAAASREVREAFMKSVNIREVISHETHEGRKAQKEA